MATLQVRADIPENRRLVLDLPDDFPTGEVLLEVKVAEPEMTVYFDPPVIDVDNLPKYFDTRTGEWKPVGRSGVVREVRR